MLRDSNRSLPPFLGSEAILAAILAGGTPALPEGGVNGYEKHALL